MLRFLALLLQRSFGNDLISWDQEEATDNTAGDPCRKLAEW
jgi:hypothetical protein